MNRDKRSKEKKDYQDYQANKEGLGFLENQVLKEFQVWQDFLEQPEEKVSLAYQEYLVIEVILALKDDQEFQEGTETKEIKEMLVQLDLEDQKEVMVFQVDQGH